MLKLIVGLGNPGQQYEKTRHNAGFLFLDHLVASFGGEWRFESRFEGLVARCNIGGQKILLLKPVVFMNKSGASVGKIVRYYNIGLDEILVVHDELDFDAGDARLKLNGGHAGHNGLKDVIAHLNNKDFWRLRIGIGRPASDKSVADYVLSSFSKNEMMLISRIFTYIDAHIDAIAEGSNLYLVMNSLNAASK
jgi:PTH1 family peptidyl-tRNA hydrolase